jgi:PRTRC genetic system ThiF family protein
MKHYSSLWSADELMETHSIHPELLQRRVRVLVVGCGATGSAVAGGLPHLHQALIAYGHPEGLHVTVMDGDLISPTNSVRQPFARCEVGQNKAVVLVNRLNIFWGLDWEAMPVNLGPHDRIERTDIVIGCVDTRAARAAIRDATVGDSDIVYNLDIGNTSDCGQFILGQPLNQVNRRSRTRLRTIFELYPESVDASLDDDDLPSCSAAEAIEKQSPFVNQVLAQHALALLARLFRYGNISYHGGFFNLRDGCGGRLPVDPDVWRRIRSRNGVKATSLDFDLAALQVA